jgi:long-chain acyl-CoA synthetase
MPFDSLPQMFFAQAERFAHQPRYRYKRGGQWREVSWTASAERVRALAAALVDLGVVPGDPIGLLSSTRPEWVEVDLAILAAGGITVPIYPSNLDAECGYILWNAGAKLAVVEDARQAAKVAAVTEGFELDDVRERAPVQTTIRIDAEGEQGLGALLENGRRAWSRHGDEIQRRVTARRRDELATIVYTSGTTGPPKGVMQTHGNHLAALEAVGRIGLVKPGDVDFFFLPLAHSFARMMEYIGLYLGTLTVFAQSLDTLLDDLREAQPHFIPAVPRIFEKIYARAQSNREAAGGLKRRLVDWAFGVGQARSGREQRGEPVPAFLAGQAAVADRLVFAKLRALLGGRIRFLVSGGAPLAKEIAEFFHAAGLLVLEGYGLTETTPILTCNRPDAYRFGTVGRPVDGVTLRLAPDGEILAKGPNVALGYYKRPEDTAEAWDPEGWFHTGDIGEFDPDGFLRITDRKKDLIKTSGAKFVAPQPIENLLKTQPHISQAIVLGDNRRYCVALLTVDAEAVEQWARTQGGRLPERAAWPEHAPLLALVGEEVAAVNRQLPSFATIKYFRVLPHELSVETGELTPSLKVKRRVIAERYAALIEQMYQ